MNFFNIEGSKYVDLNRVGTIDKVNVPSGEFGEESFKVVMNTETLVFENEAERNKVYNKILERLIYKKPSLKSVFKKIIVAVLED